MKDAISPQSAQDPSINIITLSMPHHAGHSGYDRIIDYLKVDKLILNEDMGYTTRALVWAMSSMIYKSGLRWYNRYSLASELKSAIAWCRQHGSIFHYLYGENSYRYLGNMKRITRRNALIATYHLPPHRFPQILTETTHMKWLDAIITVSTAQQEFYSQFVGSDRVFYVPHGIDVEYYSPGIEWKEEAEKIKCLFVGTHLRDVDTLSEVAGYLEKWDSRYEVVAISSEKNRQILAGNPNVTFLSGISDEELLRMYKESQMLLLPLLDATANNSILEAMACGLPIVSTDLPGIRDYVSDEIALLSNKGDARTMAENVIQMGSNTSKLQEISQASRRHALNFDWRVVAGQLSDIYKTISL